MSVARIGEEFSMNSPGTRALQYLFNPRSIAILGASSDLNKVSGRPLAYMLRFQYPGKIYPINPKYRDIAGVKCFPSLDDVPGDIDALMMIVPAEEILANLEAGLHKGLKAAIIISGGFAETGEHGRKLQEEVSAFAKRTGVLVYGPNTTGIASLVYRNVATFSQSLEVIDDLVPGKTGLITQSGAFGASIFVRAMRVGLGISHWVATGNEADLEFCDFLNYMVDDPHTRVIAGFLAGVKDGQKFIAALERAAEKGKPVVLLKVGSTEASQRAAVSHTGAMVGSARAYEAVFRQKGAIFARDIQELIDFSMALSMTPLPKGNRTGVLTESGGGGILLTERCAQEGLDVAEILGPTREQLKTVVPTLGSVQNPVDLTGQSLTNPGLVKDALEVMLAADDFDIVVPLLLMSKATAERKTKDLLQVFEQYGDRTTLMVCWPEGPKESVRSLMQRGIFVAMTPTRCAEALHALVSYAEFQRKRVAGTGELSEGLPADRKSKVEAIIVAARRRGLSALNEYEAKKVLEAYGIPISSEKLATTWEEAREIARRIGYPVAAKLVSPDILHKTEAGVIALNITSEQDLRNKYEEILMKGKAYRAGTRIDGVLIQEMVDVRGVETIIGVSQEPPFGPAVLFGLGGIFVEVMADVSIRVLPASAADLRAMISELRGYKILQGARGRSPADIDAVFQSLVRVACLVSEFPQSIREIDINPFIVMEKGKGARAVDALISLGT